MVKMNGSRIDHMVMNWYLYLHQWWYKVKIDTVQHLHCTFILTVSFVAWMLEDYFYLYHKDTKKKTTQQLSSNIMV